MSALDQPWLHDLVTVLSAPTVVLSEPSGQIRNGNNAEGVLHADVRVLSQAVLTVGGAEPTPIGSGLAGARSAWFVTPCHTSPECITSTRAPPSAICLPIAVGR